MNLRAEQLQLAMLIDNHVGQFPDTATGREQLLMTLYDYMEAFKSVMNSSTPVELDYLSQQFPGFYRFGKLLDSMAEAIATGTIEVPKDH